MRRACKRCVGWDVVQSYSHHMMYGHVGVLPLIKPCQKCRDFSLSLSCSCSLSLSLSCSCLFSLSLFPPCLFFLSVYFYLALAVSLSLSVYLSLYLSLSLSIYLTVYFSIYISLSFFMSFSTCPFPSSDIFFLLSLLLSLFLFVSLYVVCLRFMVGCFIHICLYPHLSLSSLSLSLSYSIYN